MAGDLNDALNQIKRGEPETVRRVPVGSMGIPRIRKWEACLANTVLTVFQIGITDPLVTRPGLEPGT